MNSAFSVDHIAAAIIVGILPLLFIPVLPSMVLWGCLAGTAILLAIAKYYHAKLIALILLSFLWGVTVLNGYINR